ncbi:MAG: helix-turn-helix transcriptional regulator [Candidatus Marinimicrobia bacterium]|nr:helix-turn-helix transcriptional regulator [Candidatus Neomarinimicrobiota bacterium]
MKKSSSSISDRINKIFATPPDSNQKAWGIIHDFYHYVLTYMEKNKITKAYLARKLGKSRAAISQMFNKTPNITVMKMVEIADAIGVDLSIVTREIALKARKAEYSVKTDVVTVLISLDRDRFIEKRYNVQKSSDYYHNFHVQENYPQYNYSVDQLG